MRRYGSTLARQWWQPMSVPTGKAPRAQTHPYRLARLALQVSRSAHLTVSPLCGGRCVVAMEYEKPALWKLKASGTTVPQNLIQLPAHQWRAGTSECHHLCDVLVHCSLRPRVSALPGSKSAFTGPKYNSFMAAATRVSSPW